MENESLSFFRDILLKLCLDDDDMIYVDTDQCEVLIAQIVTVMHTMRENEEKSEADDGVVVSTPYVKNPQKFFDRHYKRFIESNDGESAWPDFWPDNCKWHQTELKMLAKSVAFKDKLTMRSLREYREKYLLQQKEERQS